MTSTKTKLLTLDSTSTTASISNSNFYDAPTFDEVLKAAATAAKKSKTNESSKTNGTDAVAQEVAAVAVCGYCGMLKCRLHPGFGRPRTQKAKGINTLRDMGLSAPLHRVIQEEWEIDQVYSRVLREIRSSSRIFGRPCPMTPRHGFVDSRTVRNPVEVLQLFNEARAADPEAELVLMTEIDAEWNSVWTPNRISIGPGHDGATSGHDSFSLSLNPTAEQQKYNWLGKLKEYAGVAETPYLEAVYAKPDHNSDQRCYYTQIRNGPAVSNMDTDFIPEPVTVDRVVLAAGDLLKWEERTRKFKPGIVVWHPGGSLGSHYAIHCVMNNIPIIISKKPKPGDQLKPTKERKPVELDSVLRGIGAGTAVDLSLTKNRSLAVAALVSILHNTTAFSGSEGFWIGAGAALMQRLGAIALLGEARHANKPIYGAPERNDVYDTHANEPFKGRRRVRRAMWMFENYPWTSNYGGRKWTLCGDALLELDDAIREFVNNPTTYALTDLVVNYNSAVNQAHNAGWWLNKFFYGDLDVMNLAAYGDPRPIMEAVPVLAKLHYVDDSSINEMLAMWGATRSIQLTRSIEPKADGQLALPMEALPKKTTSTKTTPKKSLSKTSVETANAYPGCDCLECIANKLKALKVSASVSADSEQPVDTQAPGLSFMAQPILAQSAITITQPVVTQPVVAQPVITQAQAVIKGKFLHIQYRTPTTKGSYYETLDIPLESLPTHDDLPTCLKLGEQVGSLAKTDTQYYKLKIDGNKLKLPCGDTVATPKLKVPK